MRILVLGGTVFLSAEIAQQALERGHQVTCFARGTESGPPAGADFVRGDRNDGPRSYAALEGEWDAVVDVSWQPTHVRQAVEALAPRAKHWTYVSSCSVYADNSTPGEDESAALQPALESQGDGEVEGTKYGQAKVTCEQICTRALEGRLHICRPGLIGGPRDGSDRFGYWPARFARDNEPVLVPNIPDAPTQTIDVRDLAGWILTAAENSVTGTLNALGEGISFGRLIRLCQELAESTAPTIWADPAWLVDNDVAYWAGEHSLPHWLPEGYGGFAARSAEAAVRRGLTRRPVVDILVDTLEDERRRGLGRERKSGLSVVTEQLLVERWRRQLAGGPEHGGLEYEI